MFLGDKLIKRMLKLAMSPSTSFYLEVLIFWVVNHQEWKLVKFWESVPLCPADRKVTVLLLLSDLSRLDRS